MLFELRVITMRRFLIPILYLLCGSSLFAKPVALFYMTDSPESIRSFLVQRGREWIGYGGTETHGA